MKDKSNIEIGLILCIISIAIILYSFNRTWILVLVPILLFIISLAFSNKYLSVFINSLSVLPFIVIFMSLRLSVSKDIVIKSPVRYKLMDTGKDDPLRYNIEYHLNNRRVYLAEPINGVEWLYIYRKEYLQLMPEPQDSMRAKNYSVEATFITKKLIFGGYSKAMLQKLEKIEGEPLIEE